MRTARLEKSMERPPISGLLAAQVVAIRDTYAENEKLRHENKLKSERKEFDCAGQGEVTERTALRDETGLIREYLMGMGTEDSAYTAEHHYDSQGRLRFIFVKAGTVNESILEIRQYFDERGRYLWQDRKFVSGPGHPFIQVWPKDLIAHDAEKAFRVPPPKGCTQHRK